MSLYTFKRATEVAIVHNGNVYYFDALSDYSLSQTVSKSTSSRKTLHRKSPVPITSQGILSPGNATLRVNSTTFFSEGVLFDLLGMDNSGAEHSFPRDLSTEPLMFEIYITSQHKLIKLENCVIVGLDVSLRKGSGIVFNVSIDFGRLVDEEHSLEYLAAEPSVLHDSTAPLKVLLELPYNTIDLLGVSSTNFSLQQEVTWRADRGIHSIGTLHVPTRALVTGLSLNCVITTYLRNDTEEIDTVTKDANVTIDYGYLKIKIQNCTLSRRVSVEDLLTAQYDIALQDNSSVVVEYGVTK